MTQFPFNGLRDSNSFLSRFISAANNVSSTVNNMATAANYLSNIVDARSASNSTAVGSNNKEIVVSSQSVQNSSGSSQSSNASPTIKIVAQSRPELINKCDPVDQEHPTPLHCAVKRGELTAVRLLLSFGANPNKKDALGKEPLFYAAQSSHDDFVWIVKWLVIFGAECSKLFQDDDRISSELIQLAIYQAKKWQEIDYTESTQFRKNTQPKSSKKAKYCLLSIDGGGIRGLVSIQILIEIEKRIERRLLDSNQRMPSTVLTHYFNWLSGTSTGSIIAAALANGRSSMDCLRLYLRLKDDVFSGGKRPYSAEPLERILMEEFGNNFTMHQIGIDHAENSKTRLLITATNRESIPTKLCLYRNYPDPCSMACGNFPQFEYILNTDPQEIPVWKAIRRSSAAPVFFPASDQHYIDGGLMANNPSKEHIIEALVECKAKNILPNQYIQLHVSLGTGRPPVRLISSTDVISFLGSDDEENGTGLFGLCTAAYSNLNALRNLVNILIEQTTSPDVTSEHVRALLHSHDIPCFRFSPQLDVNVELDEINDRVLAHLLWTTKEYINENCSKEIDKLIDMLLSFDP